MSILSKINSKVKVKKLFDIPEYLLGKPNNDVVVSLHIPKCAGTSVSSIARANYNSWRIFSPVIGRRTMEGLPLTFNSDNSPYIRLISEVLKTKQNKLDLILGHIPYGIDQLIEQKCRYFTILRNPVDRILSHFFYSFNRPNNYLYDTLKKFHFKLDKVLDSGEIFEFSNDQTRMILGSPKIDLTNKDFEDAVSLLENEFCYVNVLENYDEILLDFHAIFGWKKVSYRRDNIGKYNSGIVFDEMTIEKIKEHNRIDILLYEHFFRKKDHNVQR